MSLTMSLLTTYESNYSLVEMQQASVAGLTSVCVTSVCV